MFNISNKSFLFFMFFLGFSFLSLPSFADLIIEPEPYCALYKPKLTANVISVQSIIFNIGGFVLLGLGIASLLKKIKWRWFIALAICLALEIVIRLLDFTSPQRSLFIITIGGGFGLLGLGIAALLKKIKWKWFIAPATYLAIVLLFMEILAFRSEYLHNQLILDFSDRLLLDSRLSLIFFVGGCFGLLGLSIAALLNKIKWRWFIAFATYLAIVILLLSDFILDLSLRSFIFIIGIFGLPGLGIAALLKKIKWKWFIALATCLTIVILLLLNFTSYQRSLFIFNIAGFGLLGLGIAALLKKIKWRWFIDFATYLAIVILLLSDFISVRSFIFIVGGFGLVGLGFAAIFGKIKWTWLTALEAGLAIVILTVVGYNNAIQQASDTGQYEYTPEDGIDDSWE